MAEPARPLPALEEPPAPRDHFVMIRGATWADYQRHLELRRESSVPRLSYLEGVLEIMSPSRFHESIGSVIGCLIEAWCIEKGVEISAFGSWTLEDKSAERGAEPDECYIVGADVDAFDRPHLAIEVVWTSGSLNKLEIYRKLRVPEVWYWRKGAISIHALRGETYEEISASEVLRGIDHAQLAEFATITPMTRARREYLAALRQ
jgi:Uma2 family endonuclease